jgi:hypothetical protein
MEAKRENVDVRSDSWNCAFRNWIRGTAPGTMCRLTTTCWKCESRKPFSKPLSKSLSNLLSKFGINESFAHLGQVSYMKVK